MGDWSSVSIPNQSIPSPLLGLSHSRYGSFVSKDLFLFGNREIASLTRFYFENDYERRVKGFVIDDEFVAEGEFEGLPVHAWSDFCQTYEPQTADVHVALSYGKFNSLRAAKFEQVRQVGFECPSYVSSRAVTWIYGAVGSNCLILEQNNLQPGVSIGHNSVLWSGNHLGHGTQVGSNVYIASHAVISGHAVVGNYSFLGVNCTLRDFVTIGESCFVGMGANVVRDLPDGAVVVAGRSTHFEASDRQAQTILAAMFP